MRSRGEATGSPEPLFSLSLGFIQSHSLSLFTFVIYIFTSTPVSLFYCRLFIQSFYVFHCFAFIQSLTYSFNHSVILSPYKIFSPSLIPIFPLFPYLIHILILYLTFFHFFHSFIRIFTLFPPFCLLIMLDYLPFMA